MKNTSPLCFLPNGNLVSYHKGVILEMQNGEVVKQFSIPITPKERLLNKSIYATRLLRLGVRQSIALGNDYVLISRGNVIQEVCLSTGEASAGWDCGEGIRALAFTDVMCIAGFEDGIYFGGYLGNMDKKPVSVYHRTGVDKWEVVYTFPQGTINHVHNIVADPFRQCLWIFTGDFDEAAAIWKVTDNFKKVKCIASNDQKYRACVIYALPEGLLYATDAPFAKNYIYLFDVDTYKTNELFPMSGSCIYGCKWKDKYVFSSTVEGDGRDESLLDFFFDRKLGAGVVDDYAHLVIGNLQSGFKEIYKEKKDRLSFLFQFGVFKFPAGENNGETLFFQPMATKNNDLRLMSIKRDDDF